MKRSAFTIVELLTVMSIIIILMGILIPALNRVREYASIVEQRSQFHSIEAGLDLFYADFGEYPPSGLIRGLPFESSIVYSGAEILAEAMVGQDLLGFHCDSVFKGDLMNKDETAYLYSIPGNQQSINDAETPQNLQARRLYMDVDTCGATRLKQIYDINSTDPNSFVFPERFVLADKFIRRMLNGNKTGMPVLYFKAKPSGKYNPHYIDGVWTDKSQSWTEYYYDYDNNMAFPFEHPPWDKGQRHPMDDRNLFYDAINNDDCKLEAGRPHNQDTYILLSAGPDGLYGTKDDVYNF